MRTILTGALAGRFFLFVFLQTWASLHVSLLDVGNLAKQLSKAAELLSANLGFAKSPFGGRNFPHLKITTYILQINLELNQHTNDLVVFLF